MMTSKNARNITTRMATHADCGAIKAINRSIYGGHDYIQYTFHHAVAKENYFPFVAEVAGNIVAYVCGHVIDDGEAVVLESARVNPMHQGKRVLNEVHNSMLAAVLTKFPNLKRMLWTSADASASNQSVVKHPYIQMIDVQSTVMFDASAAELKALSGSRYFQEMGDKYNVKSVSPVSKREALQLLKNEIRFLAFAPRTLTIAWQPCQWHESNLSEQFESSNLHISRCQDTGRIVAFSVDTLMTVDLGLRAYFDMYYDQSCSPDLILAHVLYHIGGLTMLPRSEHLHCSYHFPKHANRQHVKDCLGRFGLVAHGYEEEQSIVLAINLSDILGGKARL